MKKRNLYLVIQFSLTLGMLPFTHKLIAQSPGGVSAGIKLWLKTNAGVSTSGSNVTGWTDQSATNAFTVSGTPQLVSSGLNFNPSITLNGSSYFTGNTSIANSTEAFAVASIQNAAGTNISGAVLGNTTTTAGDYFFHTEGGTLYYGNVAKSGTNTQGNSFGWSLLNANLANTPAASERITVNGIVYANSVGSDPVPYSAIPTIGSRITEPLLNGSKLAEVILYNASKSTGTERSRIQSYLAVKYGLTLGNTSNLVSYLNSSGTTIWTGDATYQNNIVGIGKDNGSGLEQQVSTSQSTVADIVTLSTDNNFTSANGAHTAIANDNYFLITGNNNLSTTYTAFTSTNANVTARMNRIWKIQETGSDQGVVYIKTSITDATYIVTSPDATFGDGNDTYTALSGNAAGVNFSNGQFFTFATYLAAPGGVLTNLSVWYKANSISSSTADNTAIASWTDNSGNGMTGTGYNNPTYRTGTSVAGVNFNPAMSFNGTDQYFQTPSGFADFTAGVSLFTTHQFTSTAYWARILDFGVGEGVSNLTFSRNASNTTYTAQSYNGGSSPAILTTTANTVYTNIYGMTGWIQAAGAPGATVSSSIYLKGVSNVTANLGGPANVTRGLNYIGRSNWAADSYFAGYIPELILYNKALTAAERLLVHSYMAVKYGFTLGTPGSPSDYKASDGTTIWTGNATYQYNVMGIGKDNLSGLEQQVSKSTEAAADIITLSTDNNFTTANSTHSAIANDKYFLMTGNNNATTNYSAYAGGTNALTIMSRIWKVQETGTDQGLVYLKTTSSKAQFLVVSADATFTDADTWILVSFGVAAVNFSNGQYFTFASELIGPGGVTTNLVLWNESNVGVSTSGTNVTGWIDQTGTNTFTVSGTPQLVTSGLNFNPSITLNGSSYFTGNTSIANSTEAFAVTSIQNAAGSNVSGATLGNTTTVAGNYFFHTEAGNLYFGNPAVYAGTNTLGNSFGWLLLNANLANTPAANDKISVNGIAYANSIGADPTAYSAVPTIGSRITEPLLNGSKVAEVVLYNAAKSTGTERSRIQSYLAVKYGLTLGNTSNLVSYLNSAGTTIWTGDATYQNNVTGIGKDNNSGLEQQVSTSQSSAADILTISTDNNFTGVNGTHTAISSDNSFLLIGNNNVASATTQTTDLNTAVFDYRLSRVWRFQATGLTQTIYFQFSGLAAPGVGKSWFLLSSATSSFSAVNTYSGSGALSAGVVSVNITPTAGKFYTLAVGLNGTLPIELIDFTAILNSNQTVHLEWKTASEKNNDYFTIERSTNLVHWEILKKIKGAGNSTTLLTYLQQDVEPYKGINYYRLKQTDFDGSYSYSSIKQVLLGDQGNDSDLLLYPNPVDDKTILEGNAFELSSIRITDVLGQDVTSFTGIHTILPTKAEINVKNLAAGIYLIKTNTKTIKFNKM